MQKLCKIAVIACLAIASAGTACAETTNVRIYSILDEQANLTIDDRPVYQMDPSSVNFFWLDTGQHHLVLVTASGETVTLDVSLDDSQMAVSRGRSWWCVTAGRTSGTNELQFVLDSRDQCASMLAVAPADDVPPGD